MNDVPRLLDTEERRREICQAALRVLVAEGPGGMSVRKVAAEAGLPPSSLRYVFPSQTAMREDALALVTDRIVERVGALAVDDDAAWARAALHEVLPLDDERRLEMEAYLAIAAAGRDDPVSADAHLRMQRVIRGVCAQAVRRLTGDEGGADAADERGDEVDRLTALIDGLALHLVRRRDPDAAGWAVRVLDLDLDRSVRPARRGRENGSGSR